jgi:serine protease AprX
MLLLRPAFLAPWVAGFLVAASPTLPSSLKAPDGRIKVWVTLKDKGPAGGPGSALRSGPAGLPSARAFEDRPVHESYIAALEAEGFDCEARLKWQNRVSGRIERSRLARLSSLPFVAGVSELPRKARPPRLAPWIPTWLAKSASAAAPGDPFSAASPAASPIPDLGAFRALADTLRIRPILEWMEQTGKLPGKGLKVAVLDADFDLGHAAFDRMRAEGRIKDQYDFVSKKPEAVTGNLGSSHGAQCLSLIGGSLPGRIVASVPEADFLLYRTEDGEQESYVEEDYQAAAVERAVDSGAQVISISVVYRTEFDASPDIPLAQMDGRTRPASLAALGAARRNVLVVSAMGNMDGVQSGPSTLSVPSDADSILAVGIVNRGGSLCGYSTTGPTADGRVKPELVSMGLIGSCSVEMAGVSTREGLGAEQGTSFAAPVVAGLAALLRQALPDRSAQEIRALLLSTARNAAAPNSQIGWGLPDGWAALVKARPEVSVRRVARLRGGAANTGEVDALGRALPGSGRAGVPGNDPGIGSGKATRRAAGMSYPVGNPRVSP